MLVLRGRGRYLVRSRLSRGLGSPQITFLDLRYALKERGQVCSEVRGKQAVRGQGVPEALLHVSSYLRHYYICVSYYICVLMCALLYMCPHT
jgi:hypothetical protein